MKSILMACGVFIASVSLASADPIHGNAEIGSSQFTPQQIISATDKDFLDLLATPEISLGFDNADIRSVALKAKSVYSSLIISELDHAHKYDVVIQAGHFPRKTGVTGGEGDYVTEQEITAYVSDLTVRYLVAKNIDAIVIGADGYESLKAKIFLSLHTDSHGTQCTVGPSIGYDDETDADDMKYIAAMLAVTLGYDPGEFMGDNYTKNLRYYYGFRRANTELFEGLLEMSELTCPKQEKNLLYNSELLARNLAVTLQFALKAPSLE